MPDLWPRAVEGTLTITGTSQTLTGDVTAGRLLDQANTAYLIDPAASGTSLVTAGSVGIGTTTITEKFNVSGNIGFANGPKIKDNAGSLQLQAGGSGAGSTGTGNIYFLNSSGTTAGRFTTLPNDTALDTNFGTGADGAVTISSSININTQTIASTRSYADGIAYRVIAPADSAISVTRFSGSDTLTNGLSANDEVLLINLQGASGDTADVGNYEFMRIKTISVSTITFTSAITKSFDGVTASNQKVVVQRVPNYTNVTLSGSGSLTAPTWEGLATGPTGAAGYLTGVVAVRANGTITINTGTSITVASKGFRGASAVSASGGSVSGKQGETYQAGFDTTNSAANVNGGGGGTGGSQVAGGGGGGGHAATGTDGSAGGATGGSGGNAMGAAALTTAFLGGGGGGGGGYDYFNGTHSVIGGSGGIGGGIIFVMGNTITVSGTISANGQTGIDSTVPAGSSLTRGGGGGGEVVRSYLVVERLHLVLR